MREQTAKQLRAETAKLSHYQRNTLWWMVWSAVMFAGVTGIFVTMGAALLLSGEISVPVLFLCWFASGGAAWSGWWRSIIRLSRQTKVVDRLNRELQRHNDALLRRLAEDYHNG